MVVALQFVLFSEMSSLLFNHIMLRIMDCFFFGLADWVVSGSYREQKLYGDCNVRLVMRFIKSLRFL